MNEPEVLEDVRAGIRLVPFTSDDAGDMGRLVDEPGVEANTYVPSERGPDFGERWVSRYVDGWRDGASAGFAIRSADGVFLGFVALVRIEQEARQAEAGYVLTDAARGRGVATTALRLISEWAFEALGLQRVELHIAPDNAASIAVAQRCGYVREGVLRSLYFKEGMRADTAVYSLLPSDERPSA